jgi:uncharacterized protein (TIGR00251 family)
MMVKILIQVHTGAKKNEAQRFSEGVWHIKIAAPPVEGKANKELIKFLSEVLDISKSRISIEKGTTSHKKLLTVDGLRETELTTKLKAFSRPDNNTIT